MQAKPQNREKTKKTENRTVHKNTTKTGRKKNSIFKIVVRQKAGRGAGVTDKTIEDIGEYFDTIC